MTKEEKAEAAKLAREGIFARLVLSLATKAGIDPEALDLNAPREDIDYCSCWKGPKCWGMHGHHFYRHDLHTLDSLQRRFHAEAGGKPEDYAPDEAFETQYFGTEFAYEPCPAYRAACAKE